MATEAQPTTLKDLSFTELLDLIDHFDTESETLGENVQMNPYQQSCSDQADFIRTGILKRFLRIREESTKK